jgi:hypothetical protein
MRTEREAPHPGTVRTGARRTSSSTREAHGSSGRSFRVVRCSLRARRRECVVTLSPCRRRAVNKARTASDTSNEFAARASTIRSPPRSAALRSMIQRSPRGSSRSTISTITGDRVRGAD